MLFDQLITSHIKIITSNTFLGNSPSKIRISLFNMYRIPTEHDILPFFHCFIRHTLSPVIISLFTHQMKSRMNLSSEMGKCEPSSPNKISFQWSWTQFVWACVCAWLCTHFTLVLYLQQHHNSFLISGWYFLSSVL